MGRTGLSGTETTGTMVITWTITAVIATPVVVSPIAGTVDGSTAIRAIAIIMVTAIRAVTAVMVIATIVMIATTYAKAGAATAVIMVAAIVMIATAGTNIPSVRTIATIIVVTAVVVVTATCAKTGTTAATIIMMVAVSGIVIDGSRTGLSILMQVFHPIALDSVTGIATIALR